MAPVSPPPTADPLATLTATPTPGAAAEARPGPQLILLLQSDAPGLGSARHLLAQTDRVLIGRGPARQAQRTREGGKSTLALQLPDALVSTRHLVLSKRAGGEAWSLADQGSKNGTFVNGQRITEAPLHDGDLLEVGQTFFLFRDAVPIDLRTAVDTFDAVAAAAAPAWATFHDPLAEQYRRLVRIAPTTVPVLILGETGTGKEVVARTLHALSRRMHEVVTVNCAAIPESLVEAELFGHKKGAFTGSGSERAGWIRSADRGTLFLDEIGELPSALQATFLRALESGEVVPVGADRPIKVDFRLVSATNRDLAHEVEIGRFRADLRARLGSMSITLPPVRERMEDLGLLIAATLTRLVSSVQASSGGAGGGGHSGALPRLRREAARCLFNHPWPGNVRELVQVLGQAVAQCPPGGFIEVDHLPPGLGASPPTSKGSAATPAISRSATPPPESAPVDEVRLRALLAEHGGNVAEVGRQLGVHRELVYRALRKYGLTPESFRI